MGCAMTKESTDNCVVTEEEAPTGYTCIDWQSCEFDIFLPESLEGKITPEQWNALLYKINYELLEPFAAANASLMDDKPAESIGKSLLKDAVKTGVQSVANFAVPPPAQIAVSAVESVAEKAKEEIRKKEWEKQVVPALQAYVDKVNTSIGNAGIKARLEYRNLDLTPVEMNILKARRSKASAVAMEDTAPDEKLAEMTKQFNTKASELEAEVKDDMQEKVEAAESAVSDKIPASMVSQALPALVFYFSE